MRLTLFILSFFILSCGSVRVAYDYDSSSDFSLNIRHMLFLKSRLKTLEISDIDKKRILSSVESYLNSKGYSFSKNPDLIVSIDTKSKENVYINRYNDYNYYGWYYPYYGYGSGTYKPFTKVVGLLYIDIVDSKTGKLIWQGNGSGSLSSNKLSRDQLISNFVSQVMESYPPSLN
ncbi:MAG: DUF4136 domain-containing protein [Flavobacteriaceae bacterium]